MTSNGAVFHELGQEELSLVVGYGTQRAYAKHTIVVSEGDRSDMFYVLLEGQVKVFVSDERGKEVLLNIQGPGSYFGEIAIIDEAPRSASVMTLEPCRVAVVSRQEFARCIAEHPAFTMGLIRCLVGRVRALTDQVKDLALQDVYGRIARTLSSLAVEQDGARVIPQRLTHQDIANRVGASREMVSRILKDLGTGGYIRVENRKIVLCRPLPANW
jgi:CRP/FNR family transcriptional regulator, cyclic AMP receptor protein